MKRRLDCHRIPQIIRVHKQEQHKQTWRRLIISSLPFHPFHGASWIWHRSAHRLPPGVPCCGAASRGVHVGLREELAGLIPRTCAAVKEPGGKEKGRRRKLAVWRGSWSWLDVAATWCDGWWSHTGFMGYYTTSPGPCMSLPSSASFIFIDSLDPVGPAPMWKSRSFASLILGMSSSPSQTSQAGICILAGNGGGGKEKSRPRWCYVSCSCPVSRRIITLTHSRRLRSCNRHHPVRIKYILFAPLFMVIAFFLPTEICHVFQSDSFGCLKTSLESCSDQRVDILMLNYLDEEEGGGCFSFYSSVGRVKRESLVVWIWRRLMDRRSTIDEYIVLMTAILHPLGFIRQTGRVCSEQRDSNRFPIILAGRPGCLIKITAKKGRALGESSKWAVELSTGTTCARLIVCFVPLGRFC